MGITDLTWNKANEMADSIRKSGKELTIEEQDLLCKLRLGWTLNTKDTLIPMGLAFEIQGLYQKVVKAV